MAIIIIVEIELKSGIDVFDLFEQIRAQNVQLIFGDGKLLQLAKIIVPAGIKRSLDLLRNESSLFLHRNVAEHMVSVYDAVQILLCEIHKINLLSRVCL